MSIDISIPETITISEHEVRMTLASQLFDRGLISSGQGAAIVGISKRAFIELLGKYNVSPFQYTIDEILEDVSQGE